MSQQPAPNPVMEFYNKWSDKTPFFTRTIIIIIVCEFIISFFLPLEEYLGNVPQFTLFSFEIYRLILSPLVGNSLITLVLTLMSFPSMGSRLENSMGSASYLSLLGTVSITTNILFTTICLLLYMVGTRSALVWDCQGFWTILFSLITIECLQMPDAPRRLLFIPVDIPSKYMPVAMYALFSLFGGPQLSYAVAILVGYMQSQGHLDRFRPSSQSLEELECADGSLHGVSQSKGYVLAAVGNGHDAWIPINAGEATWASSSSSSAGGGGGTGSASTQPHHYQQQAHTVHDNQTGGAQSTQSQHKDMFPGTGHRLSSSGPAGNSGGNNMLGFASSLGGGTAGSSATGSGGLSREEIAARRVAALSYSSVVSGNSGTNTGGGQNNV